MKRVPSRSADLASRAKQQLVARVGVAVRKMGAQSVITSRTVADRFGLHTTDLEVLDLIFLREQVSAGDLAAATGLTSGSVTALIDRLAKAGYVERCDDPSDRRKVLVRVRQGAVEPIRSLYLGIQKKMFALWSTFDARDLEVIADFLSRSTAIAVAACGDISRSAPPPPPGSSTTAAGPRGSRRRPRREPH